MAIFGPFSDISRVSYCVHVYRPTSTSKHEAVEPANLQSLMLQSLILEPEPDQIGSVGANVEEITTSEFGRKSLLGWLYESLRPPLLPLWFSLTWYITVVATHEEPANVTAHWGNAAIISALVGTILNVNAFSAAAGGDSLSDWLKRNPCTSARFYVIPFCVSSYSSVVVSAGSDAFITVFPRCLICLGLALSGSVGVTSAAVCFRYLLLWLMSPPALSDNDTSDTIDSSSSKASDIMP